MYDAVLPPRSLCGLKAQVVCALEPFSLPQSSVWEN